MPDLAFYSLTDDVVRLRPWRRADVAATLAAFAVAPPNPDDDTVLGGGALNAVDAAQGRASIGYWQRVALRCGFTREALLRSHLAFRGGRRDSVLFSLLAGEAGRIGS